MKDRDIDMRGAKRHGAFAALVILSVAAFWKPLAALITYGLHNESSSHVILIPAISLYLIYLERHRIFSTIRRALGPGIACIVAGTGLLWMTVTNVAPWQGNESVSASALGFVLIWLGGFLACYGMAAFRAGVFPLLFLILMVPLPDPVLNRTIHALQEGSTAIAYFLFKAFHVPVLRQGFVLSVPGVTIEVATECSGIRSSVALFITALLAAHFYLRTRWKILLFVLLTLPLAVVKNGVRIVTLTLLSVYVDPGFLHGSLHRDGGFVFFGLALLLLLPVFLLLEKSEKHREPAKSGLGARVEGEAV
ncbi:MAG: exosortase/archaeosortase family protein [Candidatus Acidiferrales bacterium]